MNSMNPMNSKNPYELWVLWNMVYHNNNHSLSLPWPPSQRNTVEQEEDLCDRSFHIKNKAFLFSVIVAMLITLKSEHEIPETVCT